MESRARVTAGGLIGGYHALAVVAIALSAIAVHATEVYTSRYQTLPVVDWLESRAPLAESGGVPAAADLARGLPRVMALLMVRSDAPHLPSFGPPATVQRTIGGVRDAARIELDSPGDSPPDQAPISARLDVIVFNRVQRAAAWSELLGHAMDNRDPETGMPQVRTAGGDGSDATWLPLPGPSRGGIATVAGYRATVGFMLQIRLLRADADAAGLLDLSARAESLAQLAAVDWTGWLERQLAA